MNLPKIAAKKPIGVELTQGEEKYFCTCGESKEHIKSYFKE